MSNEQNKRQIPIKDAKTGEVRLSEPMAMRAPRVPPSEFRATTAPETTEPMSAPVGVPGSISQDAPNAPSATGTAQRKSLSDTSPATDNATSDTDSARPKATTTGSAKPKSDIETLEQFIAHAYGRKGQRVTLKPKVERLLAQSPQLDDAAISRLQEVVDADVLLTVPRQLLLVSREVEGYPRLREALKSFVRAVMERHPAYADTGVQAAMRNQPDAPSVIGALKTASGYEPAKADRKDPLKPSELQVLRRNVAYLLATWFACNRGLNLEELAASFLQVLWGPAAQELVDDNARLRALTEVEEPAAVGLVCQRFREQAAEARTALEFAQNEANERRQRSVALEDQLIQANTELEARAAELEMLRTSSAQALSDQRAQHEAERMHLQHQLEQLRGRLVRRLEDGAEMLEVGLTALRNRTPRIEVMVERAEHVVDALRAELNSLKGG